MAIKNNKDPRKSKYIVIGDPTFCEPTVWGFNTLADANVAFKDLSQMEDTILVTVIKSAYRR